MYLYVTSYIFIWFNVLFDFILFYIVNVTWKEKSIVNYLFEYGSYFSSYYVLYIFFILLSFLICSFKKNMYCVCTLSKNLTSLI